MNLVAYPVAPSERSRSLENTKFPPGGGRGHGKMTGIEYGTVVKSTAKLRNQSNSI